MPTRQKEFQGIFGITPEEAHGNQRVVAEKFCALLAEYERHAKEAEKQHRTFERERVHCEIRRGVNDHTALIELISGLRRLLAVREQIAYAQEVAHHFNIRVAREDLLGGRGRK